MKEDDQTDKPQIIRLKRSTNSGLMERHNRSKEKYALHHQNTLNPHVLFIANCQHPVLPQPGEFLIISTDRARNPRKSPAVPLKAMMQRTIPIIERSLGQLGGVSIDKATRQVAATRDELQRIQREFKSHKSAQRSVKEQRVTRSIREIVKPLHRELVASSSQLMHLTVLSGIAKEPEFLLHKRTKSVVRPPSESLRRLRQQIESEAQNRSTQRRGRNSRGTYHVTIVPRLDESYLNTQRVSSTTLTKLRDKKESEVFDKTMVKTEFAVAAEREVQKEFHVITLEAYDPCVDTEQGEKLLEDLRGADGRVRGKCKWFHQSGAFDFRDCEILSYDPIETRYTIKWQHTGAHKSVSRFSLRIDGEDLGSLERRIEMAARSRGIAEKVVQCAALIASLQVNYPPLSVPATERILHLIRAFPQDKRPYRDVARYLALDSASRAQRGRHQFAFPSLSIPDELEALQAMGVNMQTLRDLFREVEEDYERSFKTMKFEAELPYREDFFKKFREIIPLQKFIPPYERDTHVANAKVAIQNRSQPFLKVLRTVNKRLHQGSAGRLEVLFDVRNRMRKLEEKKFFAVSYEHPIELKTYVETNSINNNELMIEWKEFMEQVSKKVNTIARGVKGGAKSKLHELAKRSSRDAALKTVERFQYLLNLFFERSMRNSFEQSLEGLIRDLEELAEHYAESLSCSRETLGSFKFTIESMRQIAEDTVLNARIKTKLQFKCELVYDRAQGVHVSPRIEKWRKAILQIVEEVVDLLASHPCLDAKKLGPARHSHLSSVIDRQDPFIAKSRAELTRLFEVLLNVPIQLQTILNEYKDILEYNGESMKEKYSSSSVANKEYEAMFEKLKTSQTQLNQLLKTDFVSLGLFRVNCVNLRKLFKSQLSKVFSQLHHCVRHRISGNAKRIEAAVKEIVAKLTQTPPYIEELVEQNEFIKDIGAKAVDIQELIKDVFAKISLLENYQYSLSEKEFEKIYTSFSKTQAIAAIRREAMSRNAMLWEEYKGRLRLEASKLLADIYEAKGHLNQLMAKTELREYKTISYDYNQLGEVIGKLTARSEVILAREKLLLLDNTSFGDLHEMQRTFEPYRMLWHIASEYFYNYPEWTTGPIADIDRVKLAEDIDSHITVLQEYIGKSLVDNAHVMLVAKVLLANFLEFKPMLPLIYDLRNPAMQNYHWNALNKITGINIPMDGRVSLKDLLSRGLERWKDQINETSHYATKERAIIKEIEKMRREWFNTRLEMKEYKKTDIHLLASLGKVIETLEEHLAKTISLSSSPYRKYIEREILNWKGSLAKALEIAEMWEQILKNWEILYSLFSSSELALQLAKEGAEFKDISERWLNVMASVRQNPVVVDCLFQSKRYEVYEEINKKLEKITANVCDYLELKRLKFPRFFLLSNEELISFLSKDTQSSLVDKVLYKCFEGVRELQVQGNGVKGLVSASGEVLELCDTIMLSLEDSEGERPIEEWLKELELGVSLALKYQVQSMLISGKETSETVVQQIAQLVNQIRWTESTESSIAENTLSKAISALSEKINSLIKAYQTSALEDQKKLSNLILLDIRNREVVEKLLSLSVTNTLSYDWQVELRFYFIKKLPKFTIQCKVFDSAREYGFEYCADWSRLVITPLTARCYRNLLNAAKNFKCGAVEGESGAGKTETVGDLGRAVGKVCLRFHCSETTQAENYVCLLKAVASSGLWVCMDELAKTSTEVLSVLAEYLRTVYSALKSQSPVVYFDQATIPLSEHAAVFATFRRENCLLEVPGELKTLFRPVRMISPCKQSIAQAYLEANGYKNAKVIGRMIAIAFDAVAKQFASLSQLDFSIRLLKAILDKAIIKKEKDECLAVQNSMRSFYEPRLSAEDKVIFRHLVGDAFQNRVEDFNNDINATLNASIELAFRLHNLQPSPQLLSKVVQLREMVTVRTGVIVVGESFSGKSSIIDVLAMTVSLYNFAQENSKALEMVGSKLKDRNPFVTREAHDQFIKEVNSLLQEKTKLVVKLNRIAPNALEPSDLYGSFDKKTAAFKEGIIPRHIQSITQRADKKASWLLFDGALRGAWCGRLHEILGLELALPTNERLLVPSEFKVVFEAESMAATSPSVVSRCGVLHLAANEVFWELVYKSWVEGLPSVFKKYKEVLMVLKEELLRPVMRDGIIEGVSLAWLCQGFTKAFEAFLFRKRTREELEDEYSEMQQKLIRRAEYRKLEGKEVDTPEEGSPLADQVPEIAGTYFSALIWSIGNLVKDVEKEKLHKKMREIFNRLKATNEPLLSIIAGLKDIYPPAEVSLDSVKFNNKTLSWDGFDEYASTKEPPIDKILIPDKEFCKNSWLIKRLLQNYANILLVGSKDSGKSFAVSNILEAHIDGHKWIKKSIQFPKMAIKRIISKNFEKQTENTYVPKASAKRFLLYIDDLTFPRSTQNSLELLRALVSHNILNDRTEDKKITRLQIIGCSSTAKVNSSLLNSFCIVPFNTLSSETVKAIFSATIRQEVGVQSPVCTIAERTLKLLESVAKTFVATPTRFYYRFGVEKTFDVFKGLSTGPVGTGAGSRSEKEMYKLWAHECMRTFGDTLADQKDYTQFEKMLKEVSKDVVAFPLTSLYTNLIAKSYTDQTLEERLNELKEKILNYGILHNTATRFILAEPVLRQMAKIARLLSICRKDMMLFGTGGSGRRKLTRMAAYILDHEFVEAEMTKHSRLENWREIVKRTIKSVDEEKKEAILFCSEQLFQGVDEKQIVDDLNSYIHNGRISGLYSGKEKEQVINNSVHKKYKDYMDNARAHIRIAISMNTTDSSLRK